jgi:hypothetical protein
VTAATRRQWTYSAGTVAYRRSVRHTLLLGWDVATPTVVTLLLGTPQGAAIGGGHWDVDRRMLSGGLTVDVASADGVEVRPFRGADPGLTLIRPAAGVVPFVVPEGALDRFLARTAYWVPFGTEVSFESAVDELLRRAA